MTLPTWIDKFKQPGTQIVNINGNYYRYKIKSVYDPKKGRAKKITEEYLGKITKEGLIKPKRTQKIIRTVCEYGNAKLLYDLSADLIPGLKEAFPSNYNDILAAAIIRTIQPTPLKWMKSAWEKLYLSKEIDANLSPNVISDVIHQVGSDWRSQKLFFDKLLIENKYLVFDLSSIFSYSENIRLAEKGHNSEHFFIPQINFALFFSSKKKLPVMLKPVPGSVRDIKSLINILDETELSYTVVVVMDRGFSSYKIAKELNQKQINFIFPLRRNFEIINYTVKPRGSFLYRDRGINYVKYKTEDNFIYVFEDTKLRYEEETTFIKLIKDHKRKYVDKEIELKKFGKIALLSNINTNCEKIYLLWKEREEVEIAFDAMKNELDNDKIYLQDDDAVRGYFFISFISLYLYYKVLQILRDKKMIGKVSVKELLFELSRLYAYYYDDGMKLGVIPAKVERLNNKLDLHIT